MSTATVPAASLSAQQGTARRLGGLQNGNGGGRTRLRLTRRGRVVLLSAVALCVAAMLAFSVVGAGSAAAARDDITAQGAMFTTVTVFPGETLWGIAGEVAPAADPRDVVDAIKRLNALDSAQLIAGQRLAIPAQYAPAR